MFRCIFHSIVFATALILVSNAYADDTGGYHKHSTLKNFKREVITHAGVFGFVPGSGPTDEKLDGASAVTRLKGGARYSVNTRGLAPGEAHTVWYGVFNNPAACATPCECAGVDVPNPDTDFGMFWAGGRVADEYGQLDIEGLITYGEFNNDQVLIGSPMKVPSAEIQIVLRTHGAASDDPLLLDEQLSTYLGGCDTNACADYIITIHRSPFCRVD